MNNDVLISPLTPEEICITTTVKQRRSIILISGHSSKNDSVPRILDSNIHNVVTSYIIFCQEKKTRISGNVIFSSKFNDVYFSE